MRNRSLPLLPALMLVLSLGGAFAATHADAADPAAASAAASSTTAATAAVTTAGTTAGIAAATAATAPGAIAAPSEDTIAALAARIDANDPGAGAVLAALRSDHPGDPSVGALRVRWLLQQEKREDALDLAQELADEFPDHAQVQYWLGNAYGQRIGEVGMLRQATYAPSLRAAFERALALDPTIHEARVALVEYHLQAPSIVGGDPAVARAQQRELERLDPPRGHWARGRIAQVGGDANAAADAFLAAWKARPENARYRLSAGFALQASERWDEAFAHFTAWTADEPANSAPWYQLGRLAALSGRHAAEGAAALRHYLTLPVVRGQPELQHAWWRLAQLQARSGDVAAARASLQQALKLDPELAEARADLAKL